MSLSNLTYDFSLTSLFRRTGPPSYCNNEFLLNVSADLFPLPYFWGF